MAFLLLLVKTVGRETILNLPVDSSTMHYGGESVARRHINIGAVTHVLNDLAELDQIGGIENAMLRQGDEALGIGMSGLSCQIRCCCARCRRICLWYFAK